MVEKLGTPLWKSLLLEWRIPWRYNWVKSLIKVNPIYYPKFLFRLDYKKMLSRKDSDSNVNNKLVYSLILQLYGVRLMEDSYDAAYKVGLKPFLCQGSLLGFIRDYGFMDDDTDIDLGLLDATKNNIDDLTKEMKKKGYVIKSINNGMNIAYCKTRFPSLNVDFAFFHTLKNKIDHIYEEKDQVHHFYWPKDIFAKLKKVRFLKKIDVLIPHKPVKFLDVSYGKDRWKRPYPGFHYIYSHPNLVTIKKK